MEERGKEETGEAGCNFTGGLDTRTNFFMETRRPCINSEELTLYGPLSCFN
jgi:hypothetical protein